MNGNQRDLSQGSSERFVRWQSHTMAQMSVVLALVGGLGTGGLGFCFSLLQHEHFSPTGRYAVIFIISLFAFLVTAFSAASATITRLIDFRLTACKIRQKRDVEAAPLKYLGTDSKGYGKATWRLFWLAIISLGMAVAFLFICLSQAYLSKVILAISL